MKPIELSREECQLILQHMMEVGDPLVARDEKTAAAIRKIAAGAGEDHEIIGVAGTEQ